MRKPDLQARKASDMRQLSQQPYNVGSIRHSPNPKEENMSPVSPELQEAMNQEYVNLNGQEKAQFLLAAIIGRQIGDKWLELIEGAMTEYVSWHNKQHANFQTCEYCEDVKNNIIMYTGIKGSTPVKRGGVKPL
jgi:hypothetical protein